MEKNKSNNAGDHLNSSDSLARDKCRLKEEELNTDEAASEEAGVADVPIQEEKNEDITQLKDRLVRTLAEFDNYKKRTTKEKEQLYEYSVCGVLDKILPVYDTLCLALQNETETGAFKTGVELVARQLWEAFEKLGVKEIDALGNTFDANYHNAVMHVEDEQYKEKEIVEVLQKGYMLNDKVIRFAFVKVAN